MYVALVQTQSRLPIASPPPKPVKTHRWPERGHTGAALFGQPAGNRQGGGGDHTTQKPVVGVFRLGELLVFACCGHSKLFAAILVTVLEATTDLVTV